MEIPIIKAENFLVERSIQNLADRYGLENQEIKDIIENVENPQCLNVSAEKYIKIRLQNKWEGLSEDNWIILKEAYIRWKLYEKLEEDEFVKDQKSELENLLKGVLSARVNQASTNRILNMDIGV